MFILVGHINIWPKINRCRVIGHFKAPEGGYFMTSSLRVTWSRYEVQNFCAGTESSCFYVLVIITYGQKPTGTELRAVENSAFWRHQMAAILKWLLEKKNGYGKWILRPQITRKAHQTRSSTFLVAFWAEKGSFWRPFWKWPISALNIQNSNLYTADFDSTGQITLETDEIS